MKKLVVLLLAAVLLLCGCEKQPEEKAPVSQYKSQGAFADLGDEKVSWEALNALPQKYAGMPTDEAREVVLAFWRYCKTALWMADAQYDVYGQENGENVLLRSMEKGGIYGGLPYVSTATGNIYRLLDFMDPDTGVVNVTEAGQYPKIFGAMCSSGSYWAWARVMNSADYSWTTDIVAANGFIRVGPYTYSDAVQRFTSEYGTHSVVEENGEQVMFESYAQLQVADGLGYSRVGGVGHIVMCSIAPHVEYLEDGTIDGEKSFIHVIDQGDVWKEGVSANGLNYTFESSVDRKITFANLFKSCYIPYTFADLLGTDPIEETEISFSHTGDTVTEKQLFSAKVTANYAISDIYVYVYDKAGNEVYKHAVRARAHSTMEMKVHKLVGESYTWGSWDDLSAEENYTVKIEVQLSTGERPVVYNGKLKIEI